MKINLKEQIDFTYPPEGGGCVWSRTALRKTHLAFNNKGISLIETLVVTAILGVSTLGLLKASQQTLLTSKEINLHKDTEDFKDSVYNILNLYCEKNLKPGVLTLDPSPDFDRVDQLMALNDALFRVRTDDPTQKPIKKNFRNVIEILDMKLSTQTKTFYLYYKYNFPSLGAQQTRTSDPCTNTNIKGCYYLSCKLDYKCTNNDCNDPADMCKPLDCGVVEANIDEIKCATGQVLVGVTGDPRKDCKPGCPQGQFLVGIKEIIKENSQREKVAECAEELDCPAGEVVVKSEPDPHTGVHIMKCEKMACPEDTNQHVVLVNGEMKCKKICHGGQRLINNKCGCPHGEPDQHGNCNCPEEKEEDNNGNCVCPYGEVDDGNNGCECGSGRFRNHNDICICLNYGVDDGNGNCNCPEDAIEIIVNGSRSCQCKSGGNRNSAGKCLCQPLQCPSKNKCVCDYRGKVETGQLQGRCKRNPNNPVPISWFRDIINIPCPE